MWLKYQLCFPCLPNNILVCLVCVLSRGETGTCGSLYQNLGNKPFAGLYLVGYMYALLYGIPSTSQANFKYPCLQFHIVCKIPQAYTFVGRKENTASFFQERVVGRALTTASVASVSEGEWEECNLIITWCELTSGLFLSSFGVRSDAPSHCGVQMSGDSPSITSVVRLEVSGHYCRTGIEDRTLSIFLHVIRRKSDATIFGSVHSKQCRDDENVSALRTTI